MSKDSGKRMLKDCKATWAKGRNVVVNENSNTISVFNMDERGHDSAIEDIPLTYQGVSVIPHPFPNVIPSICPPMLNMPTRTQQLPDRLTTEQIHRFRDYFPGMVSLDYFLDRHIIVKLTKSSYQLAVKKVGGVCFLAWGCTVFLMMTPQFARKTENRVLIEPTPSCIPGSNIYNVDNCFSSLGVFLKPLPRTDLKEIKIEHFTVSAHSFLSKKPIGDWLSKDFRNSHSLPYEPGLWIRKFWYIAICVGPAVSFCENCYFRYGYYLENIRQLSKVSFTGKHSFFVCTNGLERKR